MYLDINKHQIFSLKQMLHGVAVLSDRKSFVHEGNYDLLENLLLTSVHKDGSILVCSSNPLEV